MFRDREDAGRRLADRLMQEGIGAPVVLALPRGGVPVAAVVARALGGALDLVIVRKIGVPGQPELAAGAVVGGDAPQVVWNDDVLRMLGLTPDDFRETIAAKLAEIESRRGRYLAGRAPLPLTGRTVIVVDDGIATGATVRAALKAVTQRGAARVILAVPVAPPSVLAALRGLVDQVICLEAPADFYAVGAHYRSFEQVPDDEVAAILRDAGGAAAQA